MGNKSRAPYKTAAQRAEEAQEKRDAKELQRRQQERLREQDSEIAERKAAKRRFGRGRQSLIRTSEIGLPGNDTLA